jgi:hypothetical protein
MNKAYVIREAYFFYTDECFVPQGWARIVERFTEKRKAEGRARELSRKQFHSVTGSLSDWTFDAPDKVNAVLEFAKEHFPECWQKAQAGGGTPEEMLRRLRFPVSVSGKLNDQLLELLGAKFYDVFEFDAEPTFYKLELNASFFADGRRPWFQLNEQGFPLVYNSRESALKEACKRVYRALAPWANENSPPGLRGSIAQLSHSPKALAALVADGVAG